MEKENDILETTLSLAENGYSQAYDFLLAAYEKDAKSFGPQTLYFLSCLAGGANMPKESISWLRKSIKDNGWWYRPEVLDDGDLDALKENPEFLTLKSVSDARYEEAVMDSKPLFSWKEKTADNLFLAVHGNTQNGRTARDDWMPTVGENDSWQLETIQSGEPDGYGTYRWSYDMVSYLSAADAVAKVQSEGYQKIVCGGFSSGCDVLLRTIAFTSVRCDLLILQSPWIPFLEAHAADSVQAIREKNIKLRIFCGSEDEDCLPLAKQLYTLAKRDGLDVKFSVQENSRHQFPEKPYSLMELLS